VVARSPAESNGESNDKGKTSSIKVAIVDDHPMVAEGLARLVASESDLEFVGVAGSVADAVSLVAREGPDVVLMDYHLPDGDGAEATASILRRWPHVKVLMLSGSSETEVLSKAIEAGCSGFISKNRRAGDIMSAVRSVARGEIVMRADQLAEVMNRLSAPANSEGLTARELEILRLLAKGRSSAEIAIELFLSKHTVRNHIRNILMKLDAHTMLAAVAVATRDGILSLNEIG